MELHIRQCRVEDLPAVMHLLAELGEVASGSPGLTLPEVERMYSAMERLPDVYLNLVAAADGEVAGFMSLIFFMTLFHRGGTAQINELVVDSAHRGKGIGRALIERARAEALARGLDELEVGTEQDNHAARRFYHSQGFDQEYVLLGMEFEGE